MNRFSDHQRGNVLFLILIAVALFAALSYAVTQSSRSGADGVTKDKARLIAGEILNYGTMMEQAVTRLRTINRCGETQISFVNGIDTNYTNPSSPGTTCHVFHPDGGGMSWREAPQNANDGTAWMIKGSESVPQVGTSSSELILYLFGVNDDVCKEINRGTGQANPAVILEENGTAGSYFVGTYSLGNSFECSYGPTGNCNGRYQACVKLQSSGANMFYQVLMAR